MSDRVLGRGFFVLLMVSTAFPVVASLLPETPHPVVGIIDVAIAAAVAVSVIVIDLRTSGRSDPAADRIVARVTRWAGTVPLGLLALAFLGAGVRWDILLMGLAWRAWAFLHALRGAVHLSLANPTPPPGVE